MLRSRVVSGMFALLLAMAPASGAVTAAAALGVIPAEVLVSQLAMMRTDLDRYRAALDAGRFGEPQPGDVERFDALTARVDELSAQAGAVTESDMVSLVFDAAILLQELAAREGTDPALVQEIEFMFRPAFPLPDASAPVATAPVATAPATVPATVPATTAPVAASTTPATTTPATTLPTTTPATTVATPVDGPRVIDGRTVQTWVLRIIAATAALAVVAYAFERWRRSRLPTPAGRPGIHDLFDVGRRLAGVASTDEVEEVAVRQAARLTGAAGGAFVRLGDRRLSVGFETADGLLDGDRLRDGVLDRVVGTGADVSLPSTVDPAVRAVPVSVMAVPVYRAGSVAGALVMVRDAANPFVDHELRMLSDLKPIVSAAFEQVHHTQSVRAEAYADGLTGVPNRRALDLAVGALDDAPFAAVMVDLDHFKSVNDTLGHQAGDELLRSVAARLVANVRPGDQVYRYGGEEFAIVLPGTEEITAVEVAERVRRSIETTPFVIGADRTTREATASLGVASGSGGAAVFARADAALYEAKRSGRNRVVAASGLGSVTAAP